ncbi:MAG TPA: hypothetical protein VIA45_17285 [Thermoanaerobaculia bacterium]
MTANPLSVVTAIRCSAPPARVWNALVFFEEIERRPPLLLRLLLPTPLRTEGAHSGEGDETRCVYDRGHLVKRMTLVRPPHRYEFEVIEQALEVGGAIRLIGGRYSLKELPGRSTRLWMETRYDGSNRPRTLSRPIEAAVCHAFHSHILRAIRRAAESAVKRKTSLPMRLGRSLFRVRRP